MLENLMIREATGDDAENMLLYLRQVAKESDFFAFTAKEAEIFLEEEQAIITNLKESKNSVFLVAERKKQLIGILIFKGGKYQRIEHSGEFSLSVVKEYWGKGVGPALLEYLLNWAKENSLIKKINLKVRFDNYAAIKLYRKYGFNEEGTIAREYLINGVFYEALLMGKNIH
ncbi:MAG: GNAT family N-acetyltransferase [Spirochaetes bacterium]|nr:GNAT family N-acetyltransferase [Spirochaetota bacterium]